MPFINQLPTFEGQVAGGRARVIVPKNKAYLHSVSIHVEAENDAAAAIDGKTDVDWLDFLVDGVSKYYAEPTQEDFWQDLYQTAGDTDLDDNVTLQLANPMALNSSPYGGLNVGKFELVVKIKDDATNLNFNSVAGSFEFEPVAEDMPLGRIQRQVAINEQPTTTSGWNEINNPPVGDFETLLALDLASSEITDIEVYRGRELVRELTRDDMKQMIVKDRALRLPSTHANHFAVVFDVNGRPDKGLALTAPLRIRYKSSGTTAFTLWCRGIENTGR